MTGKLFFCVTIALVFFSCEKNFPVVFDSSAPESGAAENADIVIAYNERWEGAAESEKAETENGILISRRWFVPRKDALDPRPGTTLESCIGEEADETLVPLSDLDAPFVALKIDGRGISDEDYPLVRAVRAEFRVTQKALAVPWFFPKARARKRSRLVEEKIASLKDGFKSADGKRGEEAPRVVWIAAGGDVMLGRGASEILFKEGAEGIFGGTAALLKNADIAVINLEGVISARGEKIQKSYNFRFPVAVADALFDAGIDAVLHANNHVFDYGPEAFKDSLAALKRAGIAALGAGGDIAEAASAYERAAPDGTIRLFGIASFPRERDWDGASAAARENSAGMLFASRVGIEKLKGNLSDGFDIVFFHGGNEWSDAPDTRTRALYEELAEAGADLIIGTHPHVVQGFEWIGGTAVFWSLGNYVFGGMDDTPGGERGLFVNLGYTGKKLVYLEPSAVALKDNRAVLAAPSELETFYARSKVLLRDAAP
jgi:poly-gamma-glutamate synthesis protein (capsule biosynthesis protein)